jgi:hypothetical protein
MAIIIYKMNKSVDEETKIEAEMMPNDDDF